MKKLSMVLMIAMLAGLLAACGGGKDAPNDTAGAGGSNVTNNGGTNAGGSEEPAKEEPAKNNGDVPAAEDLLKNIAAAMNDLKSYAMDMETAQKMSMEIDGEKQDQNVNMLVKSEIVTDPLTAYQEMTIDMMGQKQEVTQYITQEGIYMKSADQWMQMPSSMSEEIMAKVNEQANPEKQLEYFNSIMNETTVTEDGDNYVLTADVSGDGVKEVSKDILGSVGGADASMDDTLDNMNIDKMTIVYTVRKSDYLPVTMDVAMVMEMKQETMSMNMDTTMKSSYSKYNEIKEITVPEEALNAAPMGG